MGVQIVHRVFVVGLQKTGLTSMSTALQRLGYQEKKVSRDITARGGFYSTGNIEVEPGEFLCDYAPQHYWWFYRQYPNAKFILTWRNEAAWLNSLENYWRTHARAEAQHSALWVAHTGLCGFNEEFHKEYYRRHYKDVCAVFRGSQNFLLSVTEQGSYTL